MFRNCYNYEGVVAEYLRAAVRTETENQRFVEAARLNAFEF